MVELFANSGDPDQTPRSAASDLGLHCLPLTRLGVFSLQWVNVYNDQSIDELLTATYPQPVIGKRPKWILYSSPSSHYRHKLFPHKEIGKSGSKKRNRPIQ